MTIPPSDGIALDPEVETDEDWLTDLDLIPALEAESDAEIVAALDSEDSFAQRLVLDSVVPVADWLTEVRELARRHGPFSAAQILQIVRELDPVDDPAIEAGQ